MKILVAGASGVIGRSLVPMLVQAGHTVAGTTRDPSRAGLLESVGALPIILDVFDREQVVATLRAERPDVVIHQLTSLSDWDYAANARIRTEGTRTLVDASLDAGVRRMIAQSYPVYGPGEGPAHEDEPFYLDAPAPRRLTVEGTLALEHAVAEMPEGVILRYGSLYGPGTLYSHEGPFADQVRRGEVVASEGVMSFLHVQDAARAALLALDWPSGPVNIVDDDPAPATEWLPVFAAVIGAPPPPTSHERSLVERGISNAKARNEYRWEPLFPTWRTGFKTALG